MYSINVLLANVKKKAEPDLYNKVGFCFFSVFFMCNLLFYPRKSLLYFQKIRKGAFRSQNLLLKSSN
ncbi:hypothetical protein BACCOPRO_01961 [Phocaeicola coprophilus DSM 18228 = JCM 13818]|uniref:Uncharacterized protein n=1 Tax=Phocaeicola coprophilus DSM 18228 = JCM 13818 TaxID=547042 RepID=S0FDE5_9BACT|nr:hypothetical protein BACCOPRO_01961 [Phocaeicola coprophilus DSM 18228 = JCM 13818]